MLLPVDAKNSMDPISPRIYCINSLDPGQSLSLGFLEKVLYFRAANVDNAPEMAQNSGLV
jgi:hypothetical protein